MTFYDRYSNAVAYEDDGIFLSSGEPIAYISGDMNGNCVLYSEASVGIGSVKSVRRVTPVRHVKRAKLTKSVYQLKRLEHIDTMYWSSITSEVFFR